jgi:hypothetical protein
VDWNLGQKVVGNFGLMATDLQAAVRSTTLRFVENMAREGVEPTGHQGLSLVALPVCVSCRRFTISQRPRWDLNPWSPP